MSRPDGRSPSDPPAAEPSSGPEDEDEKTLWRRFWTDDEGPLMFLREAGTSAATVAVVGLVLFSVSGVWPPMVAVTSDSMEPNLYKGDLVIITEPTRYAGDEGFEDTAIVPRKQGVEAGQRSFGAPGSVVVYDSPQRGGQAVIHRVHFHVDEGEQWYDRADDSHLVGKCDDPGTNCPAPRSGFVTKGDNNANYDQVSGIAGPVADEWVVGVARARIPYLGWVRLCLANPTDCGPLQDPLHPAHPEDGAREGWG